jgi:hypothetical protein
MNIPGIEKQKAESESKTTVTIEAPSAEKKDSTTEKQKVEDGEKNNQVDKKEEKGKTEEKQTENIAKPEEIATKKPSQTEQQTTAVMQEIAPVDGENKKNTTQVKEIPKTKNEISQIEAKPKKESCMSECTKSCSKKCNIKNKTKKVVNKATTITTKPKQKAKPVAYDFTKRKAIKSPITEIECISCQRNIDIHDNDDEILLELNTDNVSAKIHKKPEPKQTIKNNQIDHTAIMSYINELVDARIRERDRNNTINTQSTKTQDGKTLVIVENIFYDNNGNKTSTQTQNIQQTQPKTEPATAKPAEKKEQIGENVVDRKFSFVGERRYVDNRDYYQLEKQKYAEEYAFLEDNDNGY